MRVPSVLLLMSFLFFIGCKGTGAANESQDSQNESNTVENEPETTSPENNPDDGSPPSTPPPSTNPIDATPGDKVIESEPTPGASYPDVSEPVDFASSFQVEPGSDFIAPIISITTYPAAYIPNNTSEIELWAADDTGGSGLRRIECRLDGNSYGDCSPLVSLTPLTEGVHQFEARAEDWQGNQSSEVSYTFFVDLTPPTIQWTQKPNSQTSSTQALFEWKGTDTGSGIHSYECAWDGNSMQSCGQQQSLQNLSEGLHEFQVRAIDNVGYRSETLIYQWTIGPKTEKQSTLATVVDNRPVDILFVIDNSVSMNFERSNLANRIDGMINVIKDLDWQIAIISTDATNLGDNADGNFVELIGLPGEYVLDSSMDQNFAQNVFGDTVQGFPNGHHREEGIYSSKRAIERYLAGQQTHRDFIRDGADLSIVVLSDEDESSEGGANVRITPQNFVNFVDQSFREEKNMVFHSIIARPGDASCLRPNGEGFFYGDEYDALSRLTGFGEPGGAIIGSVCDTDYTGQLQDIGQSVKDRQNSISLNCNPFDFDSDGSGDVSVFYKAPPGGSSFAPYNAPMSVTGQRITFDDLLPPGEYKVDYECRIN